jgi:RNA 3'-terminal phosphate cyclase-like protein
MNLLIFDGHLNLRERIILSIFSQKEIFIKNIREKKIKDTIKKFELDLLSLVDKMTLKSIIQISESGSSIVFTPGFCKESNFRHKILSFRSLSYFLEFIFYLILISNCCVEINLIGIRALNFDVSIENLLYVTLPLLRKINNQNIRIKIFTNFLSFTTNTEIVIFSSNTNRKTKFNFLNVGQLKKFRLIFTHSSNYNFVVNSINQLLLNFYKNCSKIDFRFYFLKIPNKNIHFQTISLFVESSLGFIFGKDFTSLNFQKKNFFFLRKKINELFSFLITEMDMKSCINGSNQTFLLLKMLVNGKSDQTSFSIGNLTYKTINFFRDVKKIFGIIFSIRFLPKKKLIIIKLV